MKLDSDSYLLTCIATNGVDGDMVRRQRQSPTIVIGCSCGTWLWHDIEETCHRCSQPFRVLRKELAEVLISAYLVGGEEACRAIATRFLLGDDADL